MTTARKAAKSKRARRPSRSGTRRTSVSLPDDLYQTLERIAQQKKVSFAWVVRDAVEKYVGEQWPLFGRSDDGRATGF